YPCIETPRQTGAVVDAKAPGWLRQISQHVAEASKEGGFLGIGGVSVSEVEKATLTEISMGDFRKMQGSGHRNLAKSHQISTSWVMLSLLKGAGKSRENRLCSAGWWI